MLEDFAWGFVCKDWTGNFCIKGDFEKRLLDVVNGEVILPESAKYLTIGDSTFEKAPIRKFDFSKVEFLGEWAFYASQIEEADLSKLDTCRYAAFGKCKNLKKVVIGAEKIGARAFEDCINLETIELLNGVEEIGECAFSGTKIKSLKLPESVKKFDLSAILSTPLEELDMPKNSNVKVTFPTNFRRECSPKLSKKGFAQLLKFYPQAFYELMPSEYFGNERNFDMAFYNECRNNINAGMKMRGGNSTNGELNSEILTKVNVRALDEKKARAKAHYRVKHQGKGGK